MTADSRRAADEFDRDPEEDAKARAWVAETQRLAEKGELPDEGDYLDQVLERERRKRTKG